MEHEQKPDERKGNTATRQAQEEEGNDVLNASSVGNHRISGVMSLTLNSQPTRFLPCR